MSEPLAWRRKLEAYSIAARCRVVLRELPESLAWEIEVAPYDIHASGWVGAASSKYEAMRVAQEVVDRRIAELEKE